MKSRAGCCETVNRSLIVTTFRVQYAWPEGIAVSARILRQGGVRLCPSETPQTLICNPAVAQGGPKKCIDLANRSRPRIVSWVYPRYDSGRTHPYHPKCARYFARSASTTELLTIAERNRNQLRLYI